MKKSRIGFAASGNNRSPPLAYPKDIQLPCLLQSLTASEAMIDLNTASAQDLDAVPQLKGHGFEIVRYREERGGFTEIEQLDEVPGLTGKVGPETLKHLRVG